MRFRIGKRDRDQEAVSPAELWLADLLLGLAILFLVFIAVGAQLTSKPRPALVPTATSTPTGARTSTLTSLADDGPSSSTPSSATTPVLALTDTPSPASTSTGPPSPVSTPSVAATLELALTDTPSPAPISTDPPSPTSPSTSRLSPPPTTTVTSSPSPTSTPTPEPSPTSTSGPSPTPLPTYTPFPTQTPLPTYTQFPTPTAFPTYTPFPPPTPAVELDREPITIALATDADVLLGPGGTDKSDEQDRVRGQIRDELASYGLERAAIVFSFGMSPQPTEGNRLAAEVNLLLLEEFPDMFGSALVRNYHIINSDLSQRGQVEVEVYFLTGTP